MPFRLRPWKSRNYSIVSKNVQIVTVELVDQTLLETSAPADATGLYCIRHVCHKLCLKQPEFFGFTYVSKKPYPKLRWIDLERPVKKQLEKDAQSPILYLVVQYYIHDLSVLQDVASRNFFYQQIKKDVLDGKITTNKEQAVLLASYSLQAEWGDHQEGRHDAEMLTGYPLFPKHVARTHDSSRLLDAILWQYARLKGLEQPLAEAYYIQEAQSLPGYGSETFMARDAKGAQIYVGCTLLGLTVQYSAKETQKFYGWHTITTLNNEKRTVRLVCAIPGSHYMFVFEDVPTAKYVWKCLVKQHHFFRGNADVIGYFNQMDVKGLAMPDLQSSVMDSTRSNSFNKNNSMFDLTMEGDPLPSNSHARLRLMSQRDQLGPDSPYKGIQPFHGDQHLQSRGAPSAATSSNPPPSNPYSAQPSGNSGPPANITSNDYISSQPEFVNTRLQFIQVLDDAERRSFRRRLLPQYRAAPDYDSALRDKYGGGSANDRRKQVHSSQPEISLVPNPGDSKIEGLNYSPRRTLPDLGPTMRTKPPEESPKHTNVLQNELMYTYSSPDLAKADPSENQEKTDAHFIYGDKTPPPYPFSKSSSNSTPDLVSAGKTDQLIPEAHRSRPLLTASLGCLGSPNLSRTYENLTALNEAVLSLRNELTRPKTDNAPSFLHSVPLNYSQDNLDACYQLNSGQVTVGADLRDSVNSNYSATESPQLGPRRSVEPIYQNVDAIIANITEQQKKRAKSTSELELVVRNLGLDTTAIQEASQTSAYNPPDETRSRTNSLAQNDDRRPGNQGAPHPLTRSVPTHNAPEKNSGINPLVNYPASSVIPDVDLLQETCFGPGSQPTTLFPLEIPNMGSISSCLTTEDRKYKPDALTESMIAKIVSKDSRAMDLKSKLTSMEIVSEFERLPRMKNNPDFHSALLPENVPRNQYKDIIPYEENRVKITPSKENKTGYINASHITATVGLNQRFYICAQGPLASTVGHFWQAVWESDVRLIVMLNSVTGDTGTSKSFPYWPLSDNTSVECDQFRIYRKHSTKSPHHITGRLQLVNIAQKNSRSVWHLQYTDWVDHGCPEDVESFITFLEELSTLRRVTYSEVEGVGRNKNTPVLVHCSAGVGRSGVTILSDILLDTADNNLPIDVPKVLEHLRHQRMCLVQSFSQYQFVYRVLLAHLDKCRLI